MTVNLYPESCPLASSYDINAPMVVILIGVVGFLMVILGLTHPRGLSLQGRTLDTKPILALGMFILVAIILLKVFSVG